MVLFIWYHRTDGQLALKSLGQTQINEKERNIRPRHKRNRLYACDCDLINNAKLKSSPELFSNDVIMGNGENQFRGKRQRHVCEKGNTEPECSCHRVAAS